MKHFIKTFFTIGFLIVVFTSCEIDDICIGNSTPRLIIKFYDASKTDEVKKTTDLNVAAIKKDTIYKKIAIDSIFIPLDINNNITTYRMGIESDKNKVDTLKISYQRKDVFVSRSCGYKTVFSSLKIEETKHWIKNIKINNTSIDDEKNVHMYIYY